MFFFFLLDWNLNLCPHGSLLFSLFLETTPRRTCRKRPKGFLGTLWQQQSPTKRRRMDSEATRPSVSKTKLFSSPPRSIGFTSESSSALLRPRNSKSSSPLSDNSSVALPDAGSTEADKYYILGIRLMRMANENGGGESRNDMAEANELDNAESDQNDDAESSENDDAKSSGSEEESSESDSEASCSHDDQTDSDGVGIGSDVPSNDWTEPPSDVTVTFNGTLSNQYIKITSKT